MNKRAITTAALTFAVLCSTAACQRPPRAQRGPYRPAEPVIEQQYVHKYGLTMPPEEWQQRGQCGRVLSKRADGVTISQEYDEGLLHGRCTYSFPHCEVIEKQLTYDKGRLTEELRYYRSGTPQSQQRYYGSGATALTTWYDDGTPKSAESWAGGRLVSGEYYDRNHTLEARIDNGEGMRVSRDIYGQLVSHDTIADGQVRQTTSFHPNGNPREVTAWHNGQRHGLRRQFLPDGEPLVEEQWHNGLQHGQTVLYQNGERLAVINYQHGKKEGVEERYKDHDQVVERISWRAGEKHGLNQRFLDNATINQWYLYGKPVSRDEFDMQTYYTTPQR